MDDFQKGFWEVKEDADSALKQPERGFDLNEHFDTLIEKVASGEASAYIDNLLKEFPGFENSADADIYHLDQNGNFVWNWLDRDRIVPYTDSGLVKTSESVHDAAKATGVFGVYDCKLEGASGASMSAEVTEHTIQHLVFAESLDRNGNPTHKVNKKGVRGGHNIDAFFKALGETGIPQNEMVISCMPHPKVNGIYDIEYSRPLYDNKKIVGLREVEKPKTVYDPRLISEQQMCQWMREAIQDGKVKRTGRQYRFEGYAKNGLCFKGYVINGEFDSLFPTNKIKKSKTSKFFEKIMKKNRG